MSISSRRFAAVLPPLLLTLVSCGFQREVTLTKGELQGVINKKFPKEESALLAHVTLSAPVVYFRGANVGVKLHHSATFLKQNVEGDVDLNGALSYKPEEGAFYLKDVEIVDLTGNDHSLSSHPQLRSTLQKVIIRVLDSMPVYHLRQDDFKQQLAKLFLKNVRVKDETLILTVGL